MSKSEHRYWFHQSIRQKNVFHPWTPMLYAWGKKRTQQLVHAKSPTKLHHHKPIQSLNSFVRSLAHQALEPAHPRDQRVHHNWLWVYFSSDYVYFNNYNINQLLKREIELNFNWLLLVLTTFGFVCEVFSIFLFDFLFNIAQHCCSTSLVLVGMQKKNAFSPPPNHSRFPPSKKLRWYVHFAQRCKKARKVFGKTVYFLLRAEGGESVKKMWARVKTLITHIGPESSYKKAKQSPTNWLVVKASNDAFFSVHGCNPSPPPPAGIKCTWLGSFFATAGCWYVVLTGQWFSLVHLVGGEVGQ